MARTAGAVLGTLLLAHAAAAQFIQQGNKLVGWNAVGTAEQGRSVAISADGNTAALGGWLDNSLSGAAWVFTRSGGVWSQQGGKLVGGGAAGAAWVFVTNGCAAPWVTEQPQNHGMKNGQTATLSGAVTGTTPLVYEWYQGNAGDTSMPVGGDANTLTTSPLISTASFWVRVTNGCGTADSATATIAIGHGVRRHLHRSS